MLRSLLIATVLILPRPALAQPAPPKAAPREAVNAIAAEIRQDYFSVERGEAIAKALKAEAAAGKYDQLTDPRDLAGALSNRLRPEDAHFNVVWSSDAPGPDPRSGPPPGPPPGAVSGHDPERLGNYGFSRVEILPGNIGVIEMRLFADIDFSDPADPGRHAADAALAMVANTDAVIFDLRNNGGGSPAMVGYLVSAFTKPEAKIYNVFHSRQGERAESPEQFYSAPRIDTPLFVLISGRTGSAAEAFPYTLKAAKRAAIVGEASGGAANPGGMIPVAGGFRVFISMGSPLNPITGTNWEGTGVEPDVAVPAVEALVAAHTKALQAIIAADPKRTDAAWTLEALQAKPVTPNLIAYVGAYGPYIVSVADNRLQVRRDRRPPLNLTPISADTFSVANDPLIRFVFERDSAGAPVAVEQRNPFGPPQRQRRNP